MPKAATTPAPHMRQEAPANTPATPADTATTHEAASRDDWDGLAHEAESRARSPQQFYAELTKRPDVQAFLMRLADR